MAKRKAIAQSAYIRKPEGSHTSNSSAILKALENEASTHKRDRWQEKKGKRDEISKIKTKRIKKINETKSWILEKINKTDKPFSKPTKIQRKNIKN